MQGHLSEAEPIYVEILAQTILVYGRESPVAAKECRELGVLRQTQGDWPRPSRFSGSRIRVGVEVMATIALISPADCGS